MEPHVSIATARNWARLKTDQAQRLTKRANKTNSQRKVLPMEYFCESENVAFLNKIVEWADFNSFHTDQVVYSFAIEILRQAGMLFKEHVQDVLKEYSIKDAIDLEFVEIPKNEWDILGLIYQSLLPEGKKNEIGSYYTPKDIAVSMTKEFVFEQGQTFLDPCCGSGSFLLAVNCESPECLYGIDCDPIAVFIAKINLILKYRDMEFSPQIICADYLSQNPEVRYIYSQKFDYIATNPPWGAASNNQTRSQEILSNESFSNFFVIAYKQLSENGTIRFLFPESILNVKSHKDIRSFLLTQCSLNQITLYEDSFSGVTTKYIDILCQKESPSSTVRIINQAKTQTVFLDAFRQSKNYVFSFLNNYDSEIIRLVKSKGKYNLSNSKWALGVVTGDNKKKLYSVKRDELEVIYTGKEIQRYTLKPACNYLKFDRKELQQAAKDEYYRAPEKLVYKFISKNLVFAYDNNQNLFLNSANILIPAIPNMSIKTVMAFLNSELFQFFYNKVFGEIKVLKGNLIELPFPDITCEQNLEIESFVDKVLSGERHCDNTIQDKIFSLYGLSFSQKNYIRRCIDGKIS